MCVSVKEQCSVCGGVTMGMMWRVCVGVQGRRGMERRTHLLLKTSLCRLEPLHLILVLRADPLSERLQLTTCFPVLLKHGCRTNTRSLTQLLNQSRTLTYFYFHSPPPPFYLHFYLLVYLPFYLLLFTPLSSPFLPTPLTFAALPFTILGLSDTSQDAHFSKL